MANSAGNAGGSNEGKTDSGRGSVDQFSYNKGQRNTGKTGGVGSVPNSNTVDGNVRKVSDRRLA